MVNEKQLNETVKKTIKKFLKKQLRESNSYGWEVDSSEAQLAYDFMVNEIGEEKTNSAIVRALGNNALADVMAYLLRMYDMKGWEEYRDSQFD